MSSLPPTRPFSSFSSLLIQSCCISLVDSELSLCPLCNLHLDISLYFPLDLDLESCFVLVHSVQLTELQGFFLQNYDLKAI